MRYTSPVNRTPSDRCVCLLDAVLFPWASRGPATSRLARGDHRAWTAWTSSTTTTTVVCDDTAPYLNGSDGPENPFISLPLYKQATRSRTLNRRRHRMHSKLATNISVSRYSNRPHDDVYSSSTCSTNSSCSNSACCISRKANRGEMYIGHGRLCVCVSVPCRIPTLLLHGRGCNLEE